MSGETIRDVLIKVGLQLKSDRFGVPDMTEFNRAIDQSIAKVELLNTRLQQVQASGGSRFQQAMQTPLPQSTTPSATHVPGVSAADALGVGDLAARFANAGKEAAAARETADAINKLNAARKEETLVAHSMMSTLQQHFSSRGLPFGTVPTQLGPIGPGVAGMGAVAAGYGLARVAQDQQNFINDSRVQQGNDGRLHFNNQPKTGADYRQGWLDWAGSSLMAPGRWIGNRAVEVNRFFGRPDNEGFLGNAYAEDYQLNEQRVVQSQKDYVNSSNQLSGYRGWERAAGHRVSMLGMGFRSANAGADLDHLSTEDRWEQIQAAYAESSRMTSIRRRQRDYNSGGDDMYGLRGMMDNKEDNEKLQEFEKERLGIIKQTGRELEHEKQLILDNVQATQKHLLLEQERARTGREGFGHMNKGVQLRTVQISEKFARGEQPNEMEYKFLEKHGMGDFKAVRQHYEEKGRAGGYDKVRENFGEDRDEKQAQEDANKAVETKNQVIDQLDEDIRQNALEQKQQWEKLAQIMDGLFTITETIKTTVEDLERKQRDAKRTLDENGVKAGTQSQ